MKKYIPIDCNYYDELEALATKREFVEIKYQTEEGIKDATQSVIVDFFIKDKVEYLKLKNQITIRLDHLIAVNGLRPPTNGYCKV